MSTTTTRTEIKQKPEQTPDTNVRQPEHEVVLIETEGGECWISPKLQTAIDSSVT